MNYRLNQFRLLFSFSRRVSLFVILLMMFSELSAQNNGSLNNFEPEKAQSEKTGTEKLQVYDSLFKISLDSNKQMSIDYASKMLALSEQQNNDYYTHKALNHMAEVYYYMQEYDSADRYVNQAIVLYEGTGDDHLLADSYKTLSDIYYYQGAHEKGISLLEKAIGLYDSKDSTKIAKLHKDMAVLYREMGDYNNTIKYALHYLAYFSKESDSMHMADAYRIIASVYESSSLDDPKKLKNNLLIAKGLLDNFHETDLYHIVLKSLGNSYSVAMQYDSAIVIYNDLYKLYANKNDSLHIANTLISIGNALGRYSPDSLMKANTYFKKARSIYMALNSRKYMAHADLLIGNVYYAIYNYDSAFYYLNRSLLISKEINYASIYKESLKYLMYAYEETKDFENAYRMQSLYKSYSDSLMGEDVRLKIADLETKYETAKKERDIIKLKAEKKAQKDKELILWITFISVLVVLLVVVFAIIQKRRKDKIINQQEQLVLKKEKDLADTELEKSKLQEEELKKEIQYKSKQLTTHALNMMQKNTLMQEIQEGMIEIGKNAKSENKAALNRLKMLIKKNLRSEKDWDLFKLYFEDVNKNFYDDLGKLSSDLTSNDLKLCALLKLNMNIKESASVLNIEPASVKTARYKLRKKLGLHPEEGLIDFIRKIG